MKFIYLILLLFVAFTANKIEPEETTVTTEETENTQDEETKETLNNILKQDILQVDLTAKKKSEEFLLKLKLLFCGVVITCLGTIFALFASKATQTSNEPEAPVVGKAPTETELKPIDIKTADVLNGLFEAINDEDNINKIKLFSTAVQEEQQVQEARKAIFGVFIKTANLGASKSMNSEASTEDAANLKAYEVMKAGFDLDIFFKAPAENIVTKARESINAILTIIQANDNVITFEGSFESVGFHLGNICNQEGDLEGVKNAFAIDGKHVDDKYKGIFDFVHALLPVKKTSGITKDIIKTLKELDVNIIKQNIEDGVKWHKDIEKEYKALEKSLDLTSAQGCLLHLLVSKTAVDNLKQITTNNKKIKIFDILASEEYKEDTFELIQDIKAEDMKAFNSIYTAITLDELVEEVDMTVNDQGALTEQLMKCKDIQGVVELLSGLYGKNKRGFYSFYVDNKTKITNLEEKIIAAKEDSAELQEAVKEVLEAIKKKV